MIHNDKMSEASSKEPATPAAPVVIRTYVAGSPPSKPRLFHNGKDIALALIPLIAICFIVAALSGNLGLRFDQGQKQDQYPPYEAAIAATAAAKELPFTIRFPQLPPDWKPNSGSKANVNSGVLFNLGWLTSQQHYIQLTQSSANLEELINFLHGNHPTEVSHPPVTGWKWFSLDNGRSFGVHTFPGENIALSGNASLAEYITIINALNKAPVLAQA